jgi:divalent metal cation (Fe/Co/Zn/Cd) transporter
MAQRSRSTVLLAGGVNLLIAVAKIVAGLVSGSSAMLAEAAHSVGDTLNQGLLMTSLHRSQKPADEEHPFGYGMERYFWSLLAAVGILVLGAGFAFYEGTSALAGAETPGSPTLAYVVLAIGWLLVVVAYGLARQNQEFLIGRAVSRELREDISRAIGDAEGVDAVLELMTMRLAPDQVLVAARVDLADDLSPEDIERAADEVDTMVRERFPDVRHVFLDPTPDETEVADD